MESVEVKINAANLKHDHFYLSKVKHFFPADAFGGSNKSKPGETIEVRFSGVDLIIDTDIDGKKNMFRSRGAIAKFYEYSKAQPEDIIVISKQSSRSFLVALKRQRSTASKDLEKMSENAEKTTRKDSLISRIIRDTAAARWIKELYNFECQVCGLVLETKSGRYAEGAHIRALGEPHDGPDTVSNLLCLCPNHHVMLDGGTLSINSDLSLNGVGGSLFVHPEHKIGRNFIDYHHRLHLGLLKTD